MPRWSAVNARDAAGRYLIAIEAKADESYGETVAQTIEAAKASFKRSTHYSTLGFRGRQ